MAIEPGGSCILHVQVLVIIALDHISPFIIELDDGNIFRKALYLMVKTPWFPVNFPNKTNPVTFSSMMFPCSHPISMGFPSQPPGPVAVGSCQQDNATLLACLLPELRDGNRGGGN